MPTIPGAPHTVSRTTRAAARALREPPAAPGTVVRLEVPPKSALLPLAWEVVEFS